MTTGVKNRRRNRDGPPVSLAGDTDQLRLNRFLARAGIASRRKSDELIEAGAVQINGETVLTPGRTICPQTDSVHVHGRVVRLPDSFEYVLLNKPQGLLVTRSDPSGRRTVFDHVGELRDATVSVGRLDRDTTGMLLLTDDGQLTYRLSHPRFEIDKTYEALVDGSPSATALETLRRGVQLTDGPTAPASVRVLRAGNRNKRAQTRLQMTIHEGRNRQVRRMCEAIGHPVLELERSVFAGLSAADLSRGHCRPLEPSEISRLHTLVGLDADGAR